MADLRRLEKGLNQLGERVVESFARVQTKIAANVAIDVAAETPVDTSRAQSNWQLSEHKAGGRYIFEPPVASVGYGNKRGPSLVKVAKEVNRERERIDKGKDLVKSGKILPVYIHNLTPYIRDLNKGKSRQAPAGFIESYSKRSFQRQKRDFDRFVGDDLRRSLRG